MKKFLQVFTAFSIFGIMLLPVVHGVALGVNKANVRYTDVLRGGYAENYVTVTTDTRRNISLEYEFRGELADWMRLEPNNASQLVFSRARPLRLKIIVEPPADAANEVYTGELRLLTGEFSRIEGELPGSGIAAGSSIRASFGLDLSTMVTGEQIQSCTAGGLDIQDTETGYPLDLHASIRNSGNVRVSPEFEIDIWNQQQTEIVETVTVTPGEEVLPTTQESFIETFDHDLPIGQYFARITEPTCDNSRMVTFNVLELGGISDKGQLLRIDNEPWAQADDIIRIAAVFKNLGSRTVSAHFRGTISKDGKTVEVIETDALNVRPDATEQLETFFNPTEPGRYSVTGRVVYNGKLTFEKSSIINVQGDVGPRVTGNIVQRVLKNPYQISMVVIIAIIGGLLFLIRREKKKRQRY